jgi:hypothetical protein
VVICSSFRATSDSDKAPTIEFACKAGVFRLLVKVSRQNNVLKVRFAVYPKSSTMRQPPDDVCIGLVVENLHKLTDVNIEAL